MIRLLRTAAAAALAVSVLFPAAVLGQSSGTAGEHELELNLATPAGLDSETPAGVDLTSGFIEGLDAGAGPWTKGEGEGEWLVVPIPFKNGLLGVGVQVGAARLYKPASRPEQDKASLFGIGAMYAEGGSWAVAGGDRRYWADERIRSTLAAGVGEINYPIRLDTENLYVQVPVFQTFSGALFQLGYQVRDNLWISGGYKRASSKVTLGEFDAGISSFLDLERTYDLALAGIKLDWDTRSDQFFPTSGALVSASVDLADTALGAYRDYQVYELSYNGYRAVDERNTLAWRVSGKTVGGDPPFFSLAWYGSGVDLRGYAPGTYIGRSLAAAQAEWRWQATQRIGLVAFGGVGGVWGDAPVFEQDDFLPAGGLGLRYRLTEKFRVNFRIDYAWGKDDEVLLISVGEAF